MDRYILHCDLDCFFASVEAIDEPELKGKPLIVGADPKEGKGRGVISTCNYKARKFGLHSGMPISQAYRLCPHGIYLRPHFNKYNETSKRVMEIIKNYSEHFEQVGIDEAYIEVSDKISDFTATKKLADKIRKEIFEKVGITISIGCSFTKSLAKIASDINKPDGTTVISRRNMFNRLENMDITRIPGIGKKTKIYYYRKGIKKIGDIIKTPLPKMMELFGKQGKWIWSVANGKDNRKIKEFRNGVKSISKERTFRRDTNDFQFILSKFEEINEKINIKLLKNNISFKTITLKIRFEGFKTYTRSKTLSFLIQDKNKVLEVILEMFKEFSSMKKKIRLVGIKLSNLEKNIKAIQTKLTKYMIF